MRGQSSASSSRRDMNELLFPAAAFINFTACECWKTQPNVDVKSRDILLELGKTQKHNLQIIFFATTEAASVKVIQACFYMQNIITAHNQNNHQRGTGEVSRDTSSLFCSEK